MVVDALENVCCGRRNILIIIIFLLYSININNKLLSIPLFIQSAQVPPRGRTDCGIIIARLHTHTLDTIVNSRLSKSEEL